MQQAVIIHAKHFNFSLANLINERVNNIINITI